jgi:hypothetical protein
VKLTMVDREPSLRFRGRGRWLAMGFRLSKLISVS